MRRIVGGQDRDALELVRLYWDIHGYTPSSAYTTHLFCSRNFFGLGHAHDLLSIRVNFYDLDVISGFC